MPPDALGWQELQEEALRPIPAATRIEFAVSWRAWPPGRRRRSSIMGLSLEELDYVARLVLAELARRPDGAVHLARLLALYDRLGPGGDKRRAG